jgi:hypothetical protein
LTPENIKQCFPAICVECFRILLDLGPKTYSKLLSQAIDILIICFDNLFNNKVYDKKKSPDFSKTLMSMTNSLLNSTYMPVSSDVEDQIVYSFDYFDFKYFKESRLRIITFMQAFASKAHKIPDKQTLNTKLVKLLETILETCSKFFVNNNKEYFHIYFDFYLQLLSREDNLDTTVIEIA